MLAARHRLASSLRVGQGNLQNNYPACSWTRSIYQKTPRVPVDKMTASSGTSTNGMQAAAQAKRPANAWLQPGPAAYDFRSDTMTTPTASMLEAITNTTLLDDVFLEDTTTNDLEALVASLTGHEAALLVMSGTMGNQVAIRTHLIQPPHSVLADKRGHVFKYEAGGVSSLSGAMLLTVTPSNGHHMTLEDIKENIVISDDVHACPTKVISLENTLNGMIMPLEEIRRISAFAKGNGIKMHLDGARIWEAAAADAGTLTDFCSLFDSVSLCFSKGLGAPIGSIIVGNTPFITHARRIRKSIGGGTRQAGVISAAARVSVDETFGLGPRGEGGKLRASHIQAKRIEEMWRERGGHFKYPVETNMVWLDPEGISDSEWKEAAAEEGLQSWNGRLVVHYQISDDAVERLGRVMDKVLTKAKTQTNRAETKGETSQYR